MTWQSGAVSSVGTAHQPIAERQSMVGTVHPTRVVNPKPTSVSACPKPNALRFEQEETEGTEACRQHRAGVLRSPGAVATSRGEGTAVRRLRPSGDQR